VAVGPVDDLKVAADSNVTLTVLSKGFNAMKQTSCVKYFQTDIVEIVKLELTG
jgi:hypothetical protein